MADAIPVVDNAQALQDSMQQQSALRAKIGIPNAPVGLPAAIAPAEAAKPAAPSLTPSTPVPGAPAAVPAAKIRAAARSGQDVSGLVSPFGSAPSNTSAAPSGNFSLPGASSAQSAAPTMTGAGSVPAAASAAPVTPEQKEVADSYKATADLRNRPAGVDTLMDKARGIQNPWLRKLGEVGAGLTVGAERIGEIALPGPMMGIPGTRPYRNAQITGSMEREGIADKNNLVASQAAEADAKAAGATGNQKTIADMAAKGYSPVTDAMGRQTWQFTGKGEAVTGPDPRADSPTKGKTIRMMVDPQGAVTSYGPEISAPESMSAANQPIGDAGIAQRTSIIDQMLPNATPEQRKSFYPNASMTPAEADKLAAQAKEVGTMNAAQQQQAFEHKRQQQADQEKMDGNMVEGRDAKGVLRFGSETSARTQHWTGIVKSKKGVDDLRQEHSVLNDMQAKLNDVVQNRMALDQDGTQRAIIAKGLAVAHASTVNIMGQNIPLAPDPNSALDQLIKSEVLKGASDQSIQYIQAVLSFRESSLGLPKLITNSGRQTEIAANALWATTPDGSAPNSKYALQQSKRFQQNIDRLRKERALPEGSVAEEPNADLTGQGVAPEGHQVQLQNGHSATKIGGRWIDNVTKQEVK
jgi:hypothetical protein